MNPYYGRPGHKTAHEAFVRAIKMSYRWAEPYRIWHDKDGWYAFGERVKGTGKNIGITYQVRDGREAFAPIIRVKLFEDQLSPLAPDDKWSFDRFLSIKEEL